MSLNKLTRLMHGLAKILGDVDAVRKGTIGKRVARRVADKVIGKLMGKLFK
ncbi:hypothetical protein [Peribacillus glennii]|uniref:hypothetical protein n=1 Tax=Peribacillus glennii TaxID=2303991 RepID=UPI0018F1AE56|nr:hypothetical protein [Peribacillus glennii]